MAFTRKHYRAVAAIIKRQLDIAETFQQEHGGFNVTGIATSVTAKVIGREMADLFAADNERFNRDKFLSACGIE